LNWCQCHQLWLIRFADEVPRSFFQPQPTSVQKLGRLGTNGPSGASIALFFHLSDHMENFQWSGGYSYSFLTANIISFGFGSDLLLRLW
jgi:hypothetical protein